MRLYLLLCFLFVLTLKGESKKFEFCDLAQKLFESGMLRNRVNLLPVWMCIIHQANKKLKSDLVSNLHGVNRYGIFQITQNWCTPHGPVKNEGCHISCKNLLQDDIKPAAQCAQKILGKHGFGHWKEYPKCHDAASGEYRNKLKHKCPYFATRLNN